MGFFLGLLLLAAYGLCFGLQNKALFLHGRWSLLDRMFECSYCVGAHCGWLTWLAGWALVGPAWLVGWGLLPHPVSLSGLGWLRIPIVLILWVFGVAAWCYLIDTLARRWESVPDDEP